MSDNEAWALIYAIERKHETDGVCGGVVNDYEFNSGRIVVLWWGAEDQLPLGGHPLTGDERFPSGSHYRVYLVNVTDADRKLADAATG
jgi:hypothetical protein